MARHRLDEEEPATGLVMEHDVRELIVLGQRNADGSEGLIVPAVR